MNQIAIAGASELSDLDLPRIGPAIERHQSFPNRTNVSWYTPIEPGRIRARIFERGVGETLSSGTGATGAAARRMRSSLGPLTSPSGFVHGLLARSGHDHQALAAADKHYAGA